MTKQELRRELKALRDRVVLVETKCQEREDKLMNFLISLEPFFDSLSPDAQKKTMEVIEGIKS
tara:strand:- start:317 stop:505 length:189 start_codon:yes stop_codon:yes gene_type:complete